MPDLPVAFGMVLEAGRGSTPYALIHGEPLVRCAVIGLEEAGIEPLDADTDWDEVRALVARDAEALVLHDSLCPLTPPDHLAACLQISVATGRVVVGHRPVTDTVKEVADGFVGTTWDRDSLRMLTSPVVLPETVVENLAVRPSADLAALIQRLVEEGETIEWVEAPEEARRVVSVEDVRVLEAATTARG